MKITLVSGRSHIKHTEGGDFRQATYRAVRQGLMQAENVLLEPWYEFSLTIPAEYIGRALNDMQLMCADFSAPEQGESSATIRGFAPVSAMQGYSSQLALYTRGMGKLSLIGSEYRECHNSAEVISQIGYDVEADTFNTADSVFCSHGAGHTVNGTKYLTICTWSVHYGRKPSLTLFLIYRHIARYPVQTKRSLSEYTSVHTAR